MQTCSICHGRGFLPERPSFDCDYCGGDGEVETEEDIRFDCFQRAIANTGYRDSGSEMADVMAGRGMPYVVEGEYRRLCRKRGVVPK